MSSPSSLPGTAAPYSLAGKVALVTGGGRGIGAAIARRLAALGADVAINYRADGAAAETVAAAIQQAGRRAALLRADVADVAQVDGLIAAAVKHFGRLDVVVNNAGIFEGAALAEADAAHFERQFRVNTLGPLLVMRAALPHLTQPGGRIINVSSTLAVAPEAGMSVYSATKAALDCLTRALAKELGPNGITVNAVAPGITRTDMTSGLPAEVLDATIATTPVRRLGEVGDVADIVGFLASDAARWITGRTLLADGGLIDH